MHQLLANAEAHLVGAVGDHTATKLFHAAEYATDRPRQFRQLAKSPCPPVTVIKAPEGKIRGPTMTPKSMELFSPNTGPPTSRTVVKPRISVSVASTPAEILLYPTSPAIA